MKRIFLNQELDNSQPPSDAQPPSDYRPLFNPQPPSNPQSSTDSEEVDTSQKAAILPRIREIDISQKAATLPWIRSLPILPCTQGTKSGHELDGTNLFHVLLPNQEMKNEHELDEKDLFHVFLHNQETKKEHREDYVQQYYANTVDPWFRNNIETICGLTANTICSFDATRYEEWPLDVVELSNLQGFTMHNQANCEFWLDRLKECSNLLYLDISIPLSLWPRLISLCSKLPIIWLRSVVFLPLVDVPNLDFIFPPKDIKIFEVELEVTDTLRNSLKSYISKHPRIKRLPMNIYTNNVEGFKLCLNDNLLMRYHITITLSPESSLKVLELPMSLGTRIYAFKKTFDNTLRIYSFSAQEIFFFEQRESKTIKEVHKERCPSDCILTDPDPCSDLHEI